MILYCLKEKSNISKTFGKEEIENVTLFLVDFGGVLLCVAAFRMQRNCIISAISSSVSSHNVLLT
jgi:hypothetical protein